jgi:hypothetical protein
MHKSAHKIQRINMNRNKKIRKINEAIILLYPASRDTLFFPGFAPRSKASRTGSVMEASEYLHKERPVSKYGVRGLGKTYKRKQ